MCGTAHLKSPGRSTGRSRALYPSPPDGGPRPSMDDFTWRPDELVEEPFEALLEDVFRVRLATEAGCARLLATIEERRAAAQAAAPNSMHEHGVQLAPLGLDGAVASLLMGSRGVRDLLATRFAEVGGDSIDGWHAYMVEYASGLDEDLGFHVDDSEVTLNLCLGDTFSGAELVMLGRRCDLHRQTPVAPSEHLEIDHEPGVLVVHAGRHRHRVDPIGRGRRRNLIAWLRSSSYRASVDPDEVPSWCGAKRAGFA